METGESDIVDIVYGTFEKLKDRNNKIEEMRNYFSQNNAKMTIPFSYHFPLNKSDYNEHKNTLSYHVRSALCSTSTTSTPSSSQVDTVQPKKIIGYVGHICRNCNESESLPVMCTIPMELIAYSEDNIFATLRTLILLEDLHYFCEDVCSCGS